MAQVDVEIARLYCHFSQRRCVVYESSKWREISCEEGEDQHSASRGESREGNENFFIVLQHVG